MTSAGFEGELLFFVCFIMCVGAPGALSDRHPIGGVYVIARCETELTRTPELLLTSVWDVDAAMLFLEGRTLKHLDRPLVVGWPNNARLTTPVSGDGQRRPCLFPSAAGCQVALWVNAVRDLNKEEL